MDLNKKGLPGLISMNLENDDFDRVKNLIFHYSGIHLHDGKRALVRARLMKRIRKLQMGSFREYLDYVEGDAEESGPEFFSFVDVLTTNKTSFFRENAHFDFIRNTVVPGLNGREVKWWSAGCSSGEEPITLAITYLEAAGISPGTVPVKILATDLSRDILRKAKQGIYPEEKMTGVPDSIRRTYFQRNSGAPSWWQPVEAIRRMITYGRLNLKEPWPLKGPFHVIMCRNVMIYFNRQTQHELISRFHDILEPGGYLFLGHSESVSGKDHGFANVCPAVYQKRERGRQ